MDKYTFGNKLYKLRTESNLTQKDLANILGVSDKAVSKWETGEAMPRVKTLKNIADCFSVTYEDLLSQTEELKTNETEKYEVYAVFFQKRVTKIKKDINEHLLVVLFAAALNLIIKASLFVQVKFAGFSISDSEILLGDLLPFVFSILLFITLKRYLKSDNLFTKKQFDHILDWPVLSLSFQMLALALNLNLKNAYILLSVIITLIAILIFNVYLYFKFKKQKELKLPKREIVLYTGILLLAVIATYLINAASFAVMVNVVKIIFVNFFSLFIIYETIEYHSLREIKKDETEEKEETKVKRNVKKVIAICLVVFSTLGVIALFVPGLIFKTLAQKSVSATPSALFYDTLEISFEEENLTEYSLEGIKISLPDEYELLEKNENEYNTGLKFGKKGCDDFQFSVLQRKNFETEPLDIPGTLFSGENGEGIKRMFLNTFGYVPSTNQEYYRLLYSINPDDANIFDLEECITYFVMVKSREIYTWGGSYEFEFYDNGVFLAEITKSKGVSFSEKGKMEVDESGKFEMYTAVITFYADEQGADYYQIFYRPESGDTADPDLLHKVLNTVEKAE